MFSEKVGFWHLVQDYSWSDCIAMFSKSGMTDAIRLFNKADLKKSEVRYKTADGQVFLEEKTPDGMFVKTKRVDDNAGSYVVDTHPDMQMAQFREKIFISSQDPASDLDLLKQYKISHILNVAGLTNHFTTQFHYKTLALYDDFGCDIASVFAECNEFIDSALKAGGTVLIHCNAGVSRSATIALAFVMRNERVDLSEALQQLKAIRPSVRPNSHFMQQLYEYQQHCIR